MSFFDVVSAPAISFPVLGSSVTGRIIGNPPYQEMDATEIGSSRPKLNSRGEVVRMAVIELEILGLAGGAKCDTDDGHGALYVDKFAMKRAIGAGVRETGAEDLETGGTLTVTFSGERPSDKGNPAKDFTAKYVRPNAASTWGAEPNSLVDAARSAQTQKPAYAPAPAAPVAPAPPQTPPPAVNGRTTTPEQDMAKIRELAGYGLEPSMIQQAVPHLTIEAITALINVARAG